MDFKGKVVIVTGSASGMGAATAELFAKLSATLVLADKNESKLSNVAKTVQNAKGIKPLEVIADITRDEDVKRIVDETVRRFGKLDVLVNNAGAGVMAGILDGIHHFDQMISINLRGAYLLTSLAAPFLAKTKGNIVNVSSIGSVKGKSLFAPYCISKAGLDMFTKCAAKDLAAHGVRVNSVNPGPVRTGFQSALGCNEEEVEKFVKSFADKSPLGYISTCDDVAELIIFLASDKARSITGSIHIIDNGDTLIYSGIGATTAEYFARLSAKVVIVRRSEEKLLQVAKCVEAAKGIKPLVVKADITKDDDVKKIVEETVKYFGRIDVLINNAGAGPTAGFKDGIEHFDNMIHTNLRSVYLLTHLAAPHGIKTKGNIINISSIAAVKAIPEFLPYCVSKAGLDMFTKYVVKDLAAHGVRMNSVNPGPVKTGFQKALGLNEEQVNTFVKAREERSPFLASDKTKSITGSIYFIDNGDLLA